MVQNQSTFQVYNASAGSGKTFTLVKEYLKIVLQSNNRFLFQKILAITFTNKAAAEMKERIISSLVNFSNYKQIKKSTDLLDIITKETGLSYAQIEQKSKVILQAILQNYSSFQIKTIDSFTNNLINSFAYDLGLPPDFEVELDLDSLLEEVIDLVISKIGIDKELTEILISFAKQKTLDDKSWNISLDLKEISKLLLKENDIQEIRKIKDKNFDDFKQLAIKLNKIQKEIETSFKNLGIKGLKLIDTKGVLHNSFSSSDLPNFLKKLTRFDRLKPGDIKFEGRLNKSINNQVLYSKKTPDSDKILIDEITEDLISLYFDIEKVYDTFYQTYQLNKLILKNLIPLAVIKLIDKVLEEVKAENNIRLIAEFNQIISDNLKDQPAAFIYEKIGEKFKHFFIDEMQDTSVLQWENLIPLIDNALSEENASLLLVGDAKQAIYRWRGGKAEQFIQLSSEGEFNKNNPFVIKKQLNHLDTNYRSYSNIIEFNNQLFTFISAYFKREDYKQLYKTGNQQKYNSKEGGFVRLSFLTDVKNNDDRDIAFPEEVYKTIKELDKEFSRNEICILVRKHKQGVALANYLTENNIDIVSSETLLIKNNAKVDFIINMITLLDNFNNDDAKFNVLEFLYQHLKIQGDKHDFISQIIYLNQKSFFKALEKHQLFYSAKSFDESPFYEAIEEIIRSFKLIKESDTYIQFFLDFVFEYTQQKSKLNIDFLTFWENKKEKLSIVGVENKEAVQIMTIHKAKGLEFPVVIYPYDLNIYYEKSPITWYKQLDQELYNNFDSFLVSASSSIEQTGSYGAEVLTKQKEELELDNFNLLYVALTRAVEQLYIISEDTNYKDTLKFYSHFYIEFLKSTGNWQEGNLVYEFGDKKRKSTKQRKEVATQTMKSFISTSWKEHQFNILPTSGLIWDKPDKRTEAIHYGNLIHEMMAEIISEEDIFDTLTKFVDRGLVKLEEKEMIRSLILNIVKHKDLHHYFGKNKSVITEREMLTQDKQILIPDRLIFDKNEVIILDYKTGKEEAKHKKQIETYASILEKMNFKVKKKLLVYLGEEIKITSI